MPRSRQQTSLPAPVDYIDLTQDSPIVPCRRTVIRSTNEVINEDPTILIVMDEANNRPECRRNLNKYAFFLKANLL